MLIVVLLILFYLKLQFFLFNIDFPRNLRDNLLIDENIKY